MPKLIALFRRMMRGKVEITEYSEGQNLRVGGIAFEELERWIRELPGLLFIRKKKFTWSLEKYEAEFTFRGYPFEIETDPFDGAYWIISKAGKRESEIRDLREALRSRANMEGLK